MTVLDPVPIQLPKPPPTPQMPRVRPARANGYSAILLVFLGAIAAEVQKQDANPGWLRLLAAFVTGDWSADLNRRYRKRSCECCIMVVRRVRKYLEGPRLGEIMDRRALIGDDSMPRKERNRKSRAN